MPLPVDLQPEAVVDLQNIYFFIFAHDERAADRIVANLQALATDRLSRFPQLGRPRPDLGTDVRALSSRPYLIIYRVEDDAIRVLRVLHTSRDIDAALHVDEP